MKRSLSGPDFELLVLGKTSNFWRRSYSYSKKLARYIAMQNAGKIEHTPISRSLTQMVERYLTAHHRQQGELIWCVSVGMLLDTHYGADAFFTWKTSRGERSAYIDVFSLNIEGTIEVLEQMDPERFSALDRDSVYRMATAKSMLISRYREFQDALFLRKEQWKEDMRRRENKRAFRPVATVRPLDHFVLTPFDLLRSRGLRAFAREIALCLAQPPLDT